MLQSIASGKQLGWHLDLTSACLLNFDVVKTVLYCCAAKEYYNPIQVTTDWWLQLHSVNIQLRLELLQGICFWYSEALSYLADVAYRTMPAGLPPPLWQGQSQPVSLLLLLTWMPEAGSLAIQTHKRWDGLLTGHIRLWGTNRTVNWTSCWVVIGIISLNFPWWT